MPVVRHVTQITHHTEAASHSGGKSTLHWNEVQLMALPAQAKQPSHRWMDLLNTQYIPNLNCGHTKGRICIIFS